MKPEKTAILIQPVPERAPTMSPGPIRLWLLTGCMLIFSMVVVGGITRLTHSGLSIVEWKPVTGILPPMTEGAWQEEFAKYRESPEFQQVNYDFDLGQFKSIYWWEYVHRLLGRLMGLVFLLPFLVFFIQGRLRGKWMRRVLLIFALGALQGLLGWLMVRSGLVENPAVSHYRLALHLGMAFLLFGLCFWVAMETRWGLDGAQPGSERAGLRRSIGVFLGILWLQVIFGAFVAGLKAGTLYNTFPKMGDSWVAESVSFAWTKDGPVSLLSNPASVQFVHRMLGMALVILLAGLWWKAGKLRLPAKDLFPLKILSGFVLLQFGLGVATLLAGVPVALGVLHQACAMLCFGASLFCLSKWRGKDIGHAQSIHP